MGRGRRRQRRRREELAEEIPRHPKQMILWDDAVGVVSVPPNCENTYFRRFVKVSWPQRSALAEQSWSITEQFCVAGLLWGARLPKAFVCMG
eukprot:54678-Pyramimonas_sp.AAC.1